MTLMLGSLRGRLLEGCGQGLAAVRGVMLFGLPKKPRLRLCRKRGGSCVSGAERQLVRWADWTASWNSEFNACVMSPPGLTSK